MQEQIDMLILERISDGFFDLTITFTDEPNHGRSIEREYKSRGFKVRSTENKTTINWSHPELDSMKQPNTKLFARFTAQQVYYVMTRGKDIRYLTSSVVYQKLIREKTITDTYGMDKTAVFNLFSTAIELAEHEGFIVVINDFGVMSSNKNMDNTDIRKVDQDITNDNNQTDFLDAIFKE